MQKSFFYDREKSKWREVKAGECGVAVGSTDDFAYVEETFGISREALELAFHGEAVAAKSKPEPHGEKPKKGKK